MLAPNPFRQEYATDQDDKQLIAEALKGSRASLEKLLRKHQPFIYNVAWKMVANPADAQDITQEAMIKVITNLSKFEGRSEFRTWLYRIVVNHFLQMKKQSRETVVNEDFSNFANVLDGIAEQELTELEQNEMLEEIREMNLACMSGMLLCFTREQRLVYILGELFNADHTIGAEILGLTKANFRVRLSRARKDLSQFMNNKCGLVNKNNPCRCYKKVTAMINAQRIDSKNLLFNNKAYASFKQYIANDADEMLDLIDEKRRQLHDDFPYKQDFDRKTLLTNLLNNEQLARLMNLN